MVYISLSHYCEYVESDNCVIILDHHQSKYTRLMASKQLLFVLKKCRNAISLIDLHSESNFENIEFEKVNKIIIDLVDLNILIKKNYIEEINISGLNLKERYGQYLLKFKDEFNEITIREKIKNSVVTIIGVGSLGSHLAIMLAAIGIKKLILIDDDVVSISNLTRQIFYKESDSGNIKKVNSLKRYINEFNSEVKVLTIEKYIYSRQDAFEMIGETDLIIQTADTPRGKINEYINEVAIKKKIPTIYSSHGIIGPFYIPSETPCFECLVEQLDRESNGMYSEFINNYDNTIQRITASSPIGAYFLASYIFEDVSNLLFLNKIPKTSGKLLKINPNILQHELINIKFKEHCTCGFIEE